MNAPWPGVGGLGKPEDPSHLPGGSFQQVGGSFTSSHAARRVEDEVGALPAAWGVRLSEWLAKQRSAREE